MSSSDITAVITAHREGLLAGPSLRSLLDAVNTARDAGLSVETIAVLDDPDDATRTMFASAEEWGVRVDEVSCRDQGLARNHAVSLAHGAQLAFLDGDDLWSENWLVAAHEVCHQGQVIGHPEADWFFGAVESVFFPVDQRDPAFDPSYLRIGNIWDAMCMAPRRAYAEIPFAPRDIDGGFAYEDWHWNMETVAGGFEHRVVPGTVHFKRRRAGSSYAKASANRSTTRHSAVLDYEWAARWHEEEGR